MAYKPTKLWWLSAVVFLACLGGGWCVEQAIMPYSNGATGAGLGFVLGRLLAVLMECYGGPN
jgi:hypothetical protein